MQTFLYTLILSLFSLSLTAQVGIGTTSPDPSSILDITATDQGVLVPRVSLNDVTNTSINGTDLNATGLLIWNTNATVTGGNGEGFYYYNGTVWQKLSARAASNGLEIANNEVILGGTLNQTTTIAQATHSMNWDLSSTGDFNIMDNGDTHFQMRDNGNAYFAGDLFVQNANDIAGLPIARIFNVFDQDGAFFLYRNGNPQHLLDAGFASIFNEQGLDLNFRIESNNREEAFGIDGGDDVMFAGSGNLSLVNNGVTVNNSTIDYVASFYEGTTNGTAVQLGSSEHIVDIGNLEMGVYASWVPYPDNTYDLGLNTL